MTSENDALQVQKVQNALQSLIDDEGIHAIHEAVRHWYFRTLNERITADRAAKQLEGK